MQTSNFHTHTWRCFHASGTEREYVEEAVKAGFTHLGFSDHAPYVFEDGYYSNFRMRHEDIASYFEVLGALREEFADKISIHIGFEAEYYPKFFEGFRSLISAYPVEYLLMGQHFPGNEIGEAGSMKYTLDADRLKLYCEQVCEGIATGAYACVAHPDVLNFQGEERAFVREMTKICETAKKYNTALEINLLGIRTNRNYPREEFFEIAGGVGNVIICGSDAHSPDAVHDEPSFTKAMEWAQKYKLDLRDSSWILTRGK